MASETYTFNYTGAVQNWTVPAGATEIHVDVRGAQGGGYTSSEGGKGGRVEATLAVTPGENLQIFVGGQGAKPAGGWNGGGNGSDYSNTGHAKHGYGGGGATDIRRGGSSLNDRVVVAGGGGGGGAEEAGNVNGGGGGGGGGYYGGGGATSDVAGGGGTQSAGGAAGSPSNVNNPATAGAFGVGGDGGTQGLGYSNDPYYASAKNGMPGGAGGGTVGQDGTAEARTSDAGSGGGGGSSYAGPGASAVTHTQGFRLGNGVVVITVTNNAPDAPTITAPASGQTRDLSGGSLDITASQNDVDGDPPSAIVLCRKDVGTGALTYWNGSSWGGSEVWVSWTGGTISTTGWSNKLEGWQLRAKTKDDAGVAGPYSGWTTIPTNKAPDAPTITNPIDGEVRDLSGGSLDVDLTFNDTDEGDFPTEVALHRLLDGATSSYWNGSAWVASETWITWTGGTISTTGWSNGSWQLRAKTKDAKGVASAYSGYVAVPSSAAPVVTIENGSAVVTDTSQPSVAWNLNASDPGTVQSRYRVRWFDDGQYEAAGFDPATSEALDETGWVTDANARSSAVTVDLANGVAHRAYVQVEDGDQLVSGWAVWDFTMDLTPPSSPLLAVTDEPESGRVVLTVTATHDEQAFPTSWARVERSEDGGVTWAPVRGADRLDWAYSGPLSATVEDYEAPAGVTFQYRAIVKAEV